ncbi:beta-ketoacyl-[acyl-carrier-protein] synthase II [Streptomyces sp. RB6PN25]|uniref:Beta-ketoacyl-[acyl-carrier-protein] synthase II n=1 Tax=Streptomyces humicola TaxID=2953240 RepID=A0ABT1PTC0_9ACTN|nr:beta-ketoacyl synthase N-terminal-like domain-containing protein [Streptomyces humicola]MCQ4080924.1 beta-ketoacyl-[acyl-carrier-protein] synthase II [Streptomyces humicola]
MAEHVPRRFGAVPVVTGLGAVSAAGLGRGALWAAVRDGKPASGRVTRFDASGYPTDEVGEVPPAALVALDGLVAAHESLAARFLAAAAVEALRDAGPPAPGSRVGLFVGTVMGTRPVLDRGIRGGGPLSFAAGGAWAQPERLLDLMPGVVGVNGPSVVLASGCSVGGDAIVRGAAAIACGEVDLAICGGAEELSEEVFAMFTGMRALARGAVRPFDADRDGTRLAEGAGVVVLESARHCAERGGVPHALLLAGACAADAYHLTRPRPSGDAVIDVLRRSLRDAGRRPEEVDWVCAHGTGTPASDGIEARAIATGLRGAGRRPPSVSSLKGVLGHALGAAAALEAVVAVQALCVGRMPGNGGLRRPDPACSGIDLVPPEGRAGRVALVTSLAFGMGGGVCALLLSRAGGGHER